jgi:UDP-2,3-diacylglucosamine pyrophosphatase LpxH
MLSHAFFKKMTASFEREIGAKHRRFRFMHGHEVDPYNKEEMPSWGRMLAIFAGIFEDRNQSPIYSDGVTVEETLAKFGEAMLSVWNWLVKKIKAKDKGGTSTSPKDEVSPALNRDRAKEMLKAYQQEHDRGTFDVAIVGHTHQAGQCGDWYFNSGCWAEQTNSFVRIEPDGQVRVFDWKNGKAVENRKEFKF